MQALFAAVDQRRDRKLQLADNSVLLFDVDVVALHQGVAELRYVLVLDTPAVQRVEAYPRPRARVVVPEDSADVASAFRQVRDELTRRAVVGALVRGNELPVLFVALHDVADLVLRLEQRFQVADYFPRGIPVGGRVYLAPLHPVSVDHDVLLWGFV